MESPLDTRTLADAVKRINLAHQGEAWTTGNVAATIASQPSFTLRSDPLLEIPLGLEQEVPQQRREARVLKQRIKVVGTEEDGPSRLVRDGELRRRDSLRRREALLRGKEGSRRRQKWENDRLLGNPAFNPPEPHDWEPRPTHSVQHCPYVLAPLWDMHYAKAARSRADKIKESKPHQVPRDLREKLKRSKGAKTMLQQLEEQVRSFVKDWEMQKLETEGWDQVEDTDDCHSEDEVVFVGRKGTQGRERRSLPEKDKLLFDSLADDQRASFGRWLVHSLATYYNLRTWSVTVGNPARREAYIGIPPSAELTRELPRPLWVMV